MGNINPGLPVISVFPFAQQVQRHLDSSDDYSANDDFRVSGLILATVGLYGVTAYGVERRTREIGIRMALGTGRFSLLRIVIRTVAL